MKSPIDADDCEVADAESSAAGAAEPAGSSEPQEPSPTPAPGPASIEALRRELREAQAEVRRLRAFLSHGLRQPMAALTIWAELLNAKQASALDEQGRRYLRELTASVHRIAAMLASEMQAATSRMEPVPSDEPAPAEPRAKPERA